MRVLIAIIALTCTLSLTAQTQTPSDSAPATASPAPSDAATKGMEPGPLAGAESTVTIGEGERNGLSVGLRLSQLVDSDLPGLDDSGYAYSGAISGRIGVHLDAEHRRTALSYDGGAMLHGRASQGNEHFHTLNFSQAFDVNRWSFLLANDLNYSSQSTYGTGIPGAANIVSNPGEHIISPLVPAQDIFTFNNPRLSDTSVGQAQYRFSRRNSMTASVSYGLLHYLESSQMDNRQMGVSLGFDRKLSILSTLALKYSYQHFSYESLGPAMNTHAPQLMYERQFSSRMSAQISLGPELVSYAVAGPNGFLRRTSVLGSGSASLSYQTRPFGMTLNYSRAVNGGSGVMNGGRSDTVSGSLSRGFGRQWHTAFSGGYTRTSGITQATKVNSRFAGTQVSRNLGRSLTLDFSYTMQSQSNGAVRRDLPGFSGIRHVFGIGFGWHTEQPLR